MEGKYDPTTLRGALEKLKLFATYRLEHMDAGGQWTTPLSSVRQAMETVTEMVLRPADPPIATVHHYDDTAHLPDSLVCQCGLPMTELHPTAGFPFVQCSRRASESGHDSRAITGDDWAKMLQRATAPTGIETQHLRVVHNPNSEDVVGDDWWIEALFPSGWELVGCFESEALARETLRRWTHRDAKPATKPESAEEARARREAWAAKYMPRWDSTLVKGDLVAAMEAEAEHQKGGE